MLYLFNVGRCGILLGQCLLKVGCLLNGIQQELHFNVTLPCSHLLTKLHPVFGPETMCIAGLRWQKIAHQMCSGYWVTTVTVYTDTEGGT